LRNDSSADRSAAASALGWLVRRDAQRVIQLPSYPQERRPLLQCCGLPRVVQSGPGVKPPPPLAPGCGAGSHVACTLPRVRDREPAAAPTPIVVNVRKASGIAVVQRRNWHVICGAARTSAAPHAAREQGLLALILPRSSRSCRGPRRWRCRSATRSFDHLVGASKQLGWRCQT
jgi:hypothetical protein